MNMLPLLSKLEELDVHIEMVNNQLKINAPKGKLTPGLLNQLKEKKGEIIEFLKNNWQTRVKYTSIKPVEKKEYYVLSSAQKRMYFLQQMDLKSTVYNIPRVISLQVPMGVIARLEEVFRKLIQKHESLRTSFQMVKGEIVQKVSEEVTFQLTVDDLEAKTGRADQVIKDFVRPFALEQAPLLRAAMIKTALLQHVLMVDIHHIISDGFSTEILIKDAIWLYNNERELPPLKIQYKDYAEWQSSQTQEEALQVQKAFWLNQFPDEIPVLNLPTNHKRPRVQSFEGQKLSFEISQKDTKALKNKALDSEFTLFSVLLALFVVLMAKLGGQEDIVVGTPVAGRSHADIENIIGMFVNTIPLRNYPSGEKRCNAFLSEVNQRSISAFENQDYQFEDLVENIVTRRNTARNPLFDVMFVLQNTGQNSGTQWTNDTTPQNRTAAYDYENRVSRFDMSWSAVDIGDRLFFNIEYCTALFDKETILKFVDFFKKVISSIIETPEIRISGIEIIPGEEKKQILYDFNDTERDYPTDIFIHQLFEKQVEKTPDHLALVGKEEGDKGRNVSLTYKELNEIAGQLAHLLQEKNHQADTIVGIMMERSIEMIIGIFGILKAGGAYLPIDPEYPGERIQYILKDSGAKFLATTPGLSGKFEKLSIVNCQLLMVNERPPNPHMHPSPAPTTAVSFSTLTSTTTCQVSPTNLAYIIYTSGSTGKPKGVMIEHRSVVNLLYGQSQLYPLVESDRYLLKTAYSFDVSVTELFGWTLAGGALVLLEKGGEKDPARIIHTIDRENITHINFVPTMFHAFSGSLQQRDIPTLSRLKYIFLAGEELKGDAFDHYQNEKIPIEFANLYGPTEGTVYASGHTFTLKDIVEKVPIGKPLPNVKMFILDRWGSLQPIGLVGELCISGAGVARGYLNQPQLTFEKFINYHMSNKSPMSYIYKTGDLSRWLPDGNIEFLGRMDNQVKIRGFRIEVEEVESQLLRYEPIKEAVVLLKERNDHRFLCAYIITGQSFEKSGLRDYLSSVLPGYMIPSYFIPLEKFPLTSSGKIDRNALPEPEVEVSEKYVPPANEMEEKLCEIWSEILGIEKEKIGTADNFFEMRGNSVKLIMLVSRINNVLGMEVPISHIYNNPIIKDIAKSLISRNFADHAVVLLNQLRQKKIFCFPSQIGYGYSYMSLASLIHDYSVYAFNFIEDEDRLHQYVNIITDLQPVGPYILLGHSAAGRLTFQVTKALENQGCEVSNIIFCDCFFSGDAPDLFDKKYEGYMKEYYKYIDDFLEKWKASFLKGEVIEKTNNYMKYCHNVTHLEKVNANVHLIVSEQAREFRAEDWRWDPKCWNELTGKRYLIYEGWGEHPTMLDFGALEKNMEIIRKILDKIDHERQNAVKGSNMG